MPEYTEFKICYCEICGWYVECPRCGNNSCSGAFGEDGNCPVCPKAYELQVEITRHGRVDRAVSVLMGEKDIQDEEFYGSDWERLKGFMQGLEMRNIEGVMIKASVDDMRKLGEMFAERVKDLYLFPLGDEDEN